MKYQTIWCFTTTKMPNWPSLSRLPLSHAPSLLSLAIPSLHNQPPPSRRGHHQPSLSSRGVLTIEAATIQIGPPAPLKLWSVEAQPYRSDHLLKPSAGHLHLAPSTHTGILSLSLSIYLSIYLSLCYFPQMETLERNNLNEALHSLSLFLYFWNPRMKLSLDL